MHADLHYIYDRAQKSEHIYKLGTRSYQSALLQKRVRGDSIQ